MNDHPHATPQHDTDTPLPEPRFIPGLSAIADGYDAFILDIFGVLHNGVELYSGTINCLEHLKANGKSICLVSNTPRLKDGIIEDLDAIGLPQTLYDDIVTAGDSTRAKLETLHGQCGYFAGIERFHALFEGIDITITDNIERADFILNAISGQQDKEVPHIQTIWETGIARNLPMVCANPDMVVNIGDRQFQCAGTFALQYEQMGGYVSYHGKPHPQIYTEARKRLGMPPKDKILAVGDSFKTDMAGACHFGIDCVLNMVGIHYEEIKDVIKPRGGIDSDRLTFFTQHYAVQPTAFMHHLEW